MKWAYAATSALVAVVAVAVTAIRAGLSAARVLETLTVAVPAFFALGWALAKIGRATAVEMVAAEAKAQEQPAAPAPTTGK